MTNPDFHSDDPLPQLYTELASWYHLLSAPSDYAEEAAFYTATIQAAGAELHSLLELGCGGGNNASFMKSDFCMTLTDRSPAMLDVSRTLNPECEHQVGDMRSLQLDRSFDAVFIHDAIMYMTSEEDVAQAVATAFDHTRPGGGVTVIAPDCVRETFREVTCQGGQDAENRSLRYLEWIWDPDPKDTKYLADFVYMLREPDQAMQVVKDRHEFGLFGRSFWLDTFAKAGFTEIRNLQAPESDGLAAEVFLGTRP
jgi:SAM-dependent methyltransferase